MFSAAHAPLAKALFFGGVTHRFPRLRIAFLEAGVTWACELWALLVGHWHKRNVDTIERLNPGRLDLAVLAEEFHRHGGPLAARVAAGGDGLAAFEMLGVDPEDPALVDEFAACGIGGVADLVAVRRAVLLR